MNSPKMVRDRRYTTPDILPTNNQTGGSKWRGRFPALFVRLDKINNVSSFLSHGREIINENGNNLAVG
jgi:hypothetical protein